MVNGFEKYESRYRPIGVRIWDGFSMITMRKGYKTVVSSFSDVETFLTCEQDHTALRAKNYMYELTVAQDGSPVFESDITEYSHLGDAASRGVPIFSVPTFQWVVKDIADGREHSLKDCICLRVLGNIYQNYDLLSWRAEDSQQTAPVPAQDQTNETTSESVAPALVSENGYAYLDEPIPWQKAPKKNASRSDTIQAYISVGTDGGKPYCQYRLVNPAGKVKTERISLSDSAESSSCVINAFLLTLKQFRKPSSPIVFYSPYKNVTRLINADLAVMADNQWKKADGSEPKNLALLMQLKHGIDAIPVPVSAELLSREDIFKQLQQTA